MHALTYQDKTVQVHKKDIRDSLQNTTSKHVHENLQEFEIKTLFNWTRPHLDPTT